MVTITITAQYFENYSDTDTPHWKPKMGHKFVINTSSDTVMYCDDLEAILKEMVVAENSSRQRFEYVSHEVDFSKPTMLNADKFTELVSKQWNEA